VNNCVIIRTCGNHAVAFWTGSGWSSEYPEARLVSLIGARRIVARKGERGIPRECIGDMSIVANYGADDEWRETVGPRPCKHPECRGRGRCMFDNGRPASPLQVERVSNVIAEDVFNAATTALSHARSVADATAVAAQKANGALAAAQLTWEHAKALLLNAKVSP
jgi:hypothetical protein